MRNQSKCALAACSCTAKEFESYCSEYCRQADSHGTEKDYCQCEHGACIPAGTRLSAAQMGLPQDVELLGGRLVIEYANWEDLMSKVGLLAASLEQHGEMKLQPPLTAPVPKQPAASQEPQRFGVRNALAAGTA